MFTLQFFKKIAKISALRMEQEQLHKPNNTKNKPFLTRQLLSDIVSGNVDLAQKGIEALQIYREQQISFTIYTIDRKLGELRKDGGFKSNAGEISEIDDKKQCLKTELAELRKK